MSGKPDFEAQHRQDVPRCAEVREKAASEAKAAMANSKTEFSNADIERLFTSVGYIHVQRGRDLDDQFVMRMEAAARAEAEGPPPRPAPLVINLPDPTVVKSRAETETNKP